MKKLIAVCFAALASAGAVAATVKTATQPWVEAKIAAATSGLVTAESDPHVGLTNGTIYVHGEKVTPLTEHQSLDAYAKTTDVNAADASLSAYTTGVSNNVEAAQAAADANAAAIADETKAREDAGYLTAESDPSTALTNGVAWVRGKKVISEHQSLDDYLKTADLAKNETDPTVPSWAKATTKPTYTASEVSAYSSSDGQSLANRVTSAESSIKTINSAGYVTKTTADSAYYPKASGDAWSSYWDGDDVRVTVTNYDSVAHLPSLYLEQRTNSTASASSDTNAFRVVWRELAHWDAFLGAAWDWDDSSWQGFAAWKETVADRAWGFYDSHTGKYAPDGYTSISSSNVMICAGASYQKTATATCDVWVLTANEPYEATGVSTNGGFQIRDADGNVKVEIVKGDKHTVKAQANGVSVTNSTLYVVYNVVSSEAPTGEVCLDLGAAQWKAETDSDCPATVVWSGSSGAWVAAITPTTSTTRCFFKATYVAGGEDYVNSRVPVALTQLVIDGKTYTVGTATIDGHTVLTLTPAN